MKKFTKYMVMATGISFIFFFLIPISVNAAEKASEKELVFLNWSEYMDPDLVKEFENRFKAKIKQVYFESDELKDEMLLENNGGGYDIVLGSGASLIPYLKKKWLSPLNIENVPNIRHIDKRWLNAHPELVGYAVPYLWGTVGIAFREDLVKEPINTWKAFFKPADYLKGKLLVINDSHDTIGAALKSLGYSVNSKNSKHYDEVETLLMSQKPFVNSYSYIALTAESSLVKSKIWAAMVYNGDALAVQEFEPKISFSVPKEGTVLWQDYLVVMQGSKKKPLAAQFINFLHEPENSARLSSYLWFATPNKAAEKHLEKEHLENPLIYPSQAVVDKSEFSRPLPPRIIKKRNTIFSRLVN